MCKITFGAEPKDYEVYDFVLKNYYRLRVSVQTAAVSPLPVVPGSQSCVQFSTAPAVI